MNRWVVIRFVGVGLVLLGVVILAATFYPVVKLEVEYNPNQAIALEQLPVDTQLGIVIPKIGANARIVRDVNPFDSQIYQQALTQGVAHAEGTPLPGEPGNAFLFSHSSVDFLQATKYNSVFYLLSKLEAGDIISIYRSGVKLDFVVENKSFVNADDVELLNQGGQEAKLTLMTCWPPGTSLRRLIVSAKKI